MHSEGTNIENKMSKCTNMKVLVGKRKICTKIEVGRMKIRLTSLCMSVS